MKYLSVKGFELVFIIRSLQRFTSNAIYFKSLFTQNLKLTTCMRLMTSMSTGIICFRVDRRNPGIQMYTKSGITLHINTEYSGVQDRPGQVMRSGQMQ